ncbi:SDR family NAD(P)-dependent oxidoreductase, partial [Streptomyces buecherae]|uniref:SDR family NAD(P)-dependent oxidoreductase n=1 Tax=Streptomyces buecherae TaxID=2763006 RepID=UPI0036B3729D
TNPPPLLLTTLQPNQPETHTLHTTLATLHTHGIDVDWRAFYADAQPRPVDLPTYAFQRQRLWLDAPPRATADAADLGQAAEAHPFVGALVHRADGGGVLFTGRLSLRTHPWLADHSVAGGVVVPGAALLELALHAADRTTAGGVGELTLQAPLTVPRAGAVHLQATVGAPDDAGQRAFAVYSRPTDTAPWTRHAQGTLLAPQPAPAAPDAHAAWPPPGATPVPVDDLYVPGTTPGLSYGPAFRGVRAAWRAGREIHVEVTLPEQVAADAGRFALHPALLDAALHGIGLGDFVAADGEDDTAQLPFAWAGARLHASGATTVRARIAPATGAGAVSVTVTDPRGAPVLSVDRLTLRPVPLAGLRAADEHGGEADALYRTEWVTLPTPHATHPTTATATTGDGANSQSAHGHWTVPGSPDETLLDALRAGGVRAETARDLAHVPAPTTPEQPGTSSLTSPTSPVLLRADALHGIAMEDVGEVPSDEPVENAAAPGDGTAAARAEATVLRTLAAVRGWLADERSAGRPLVVLTRGAVTVAGEAPRLEQAPVWGLVRAAQAEHPGRFVLIDTDDTPDSLSALPAAASTGEPQLAVRDGALSVPRLTPAAAPRTAARAPGDQNAGPARDTAPPHTPPAALDAGTVLITGGTGTLGALVARHLVTEHGVRHLLLTSRRGPDAPGCAELVADLTRLGAEVRVARGDVADRTALAELLASVPAGQPLTGVVHAAGVVDDAAVDTLTPDAVRRVMAPKAHAAWALHEATRDLPLAAFVLFSSFAATAGAAGQAGYAAANAFLDALAEHRHRAGLPAVSLAWGLWEPESGITARLTTADRARIGRGGVTALSAEEALTLFDAALAADRPTLAPVRLDLPALRARAAAGTLPALLRGLVPSGATRPVAASEPAAGSATADDPVRRLTERLAALPAGAQRAELLDLVSGQVATVLGHVDAAQVAPERAFQELGFDSLTAMELRNGLQVATGVPLPATLIFDFPTPAAVAGHLHDELGLVPADPEDVLLGELERLGESLTALATSAADPDRVGSRLRDLLARWNEGTNDRTARPTGTTDRAELDAASDEDLFNLVEDLRNT